MILASSVHAFAPNYYAVRLSRRFVGRSEPFHSDGLRLKAPVDCLQRAADGLTGCGAHPPLRGDPGPIGDSCTNLIDRVRGTLDQEASRQLQDVLARGIALAADRGGVLVTQPRAEREANVQSPVAAL